MKKQIPSKITKEELIMEVAVAMHSGNNAASEKLLRSLIPMLKDDPADQHIYLEALANIRLGVDDKEAASLFQRVVNIRRHQKRGTSADLARALTSLAGVVVGDDESRAIKLLNEARTAMEQDKIQDPIQYASTVFAMAVVNPSMGSLIEPAIVGLKKTDENLPRQMTLIAQYAKIFADMGQKESAQKLNELLEKKTNIAK